MIPDILRPGDRPLKPIIPRAILLSLVMILVACAPTWGPATRMPSGSAANADVASRRMEVVAHALAMTGQPYRWGGAEPGGFDCSGLVTYAYRQAGFSLPRRAIDQAERARRVPPHALAPGDLLFFRVDGAISHVGIYMGDGRMVHAPGSGKVVRIDAINANYWAPRYAGALPMLQLIANDS